MIKEAIRVRLGLVGLPFEGPHQVAQGGPGCHQGLESLGELALSQIPEGSPGGRPGVQKGLVVLGSLLLLLGTPRQLLGLDEVGHGSIPWQGLGAHGVVAGGEDLL